MQTFSQARSAIERCDLRAAVTALRVTTRAWQGSDGVFHLNNGCCDTLPTRVPLLTLLDGTIGPCCAAADPGRTLRQSAPGEMLWQTLTVSLLVERFAGAVERGTVTNTDAATRRREAIEKKAGHLRYLLRNHPEVWQVVDRRTREVLDAVPVTELAGGLDAILATIRDTLVTPPCRGFVHLDDTPTLIAWASQRDVPPTTYALVAATKVRSGDDGVVILAPAYVEAYLRAHVRPTLTATPARDPETNRVAATLWTPAGGPMCDIRTALHTAAAVAAA